MDLEHKSLYSIKVTTLTEAPNISTRSSCEETSPQCLDSSLFTSLYLSSLLRSKPYFVGVVPSRWTTVDEKSEQQSQFQKHELVVSFLPPTQEWTLVHLQLAQALS